MEMRKFIIEIHPDGKLTWSEYEDPSESIKAVKDRAWFDGYRQALKHCDEQVEYLKKFKDICGSSEIMYYGAKSVQDELILSYNKHLNGKH
jgi:hypothetical protein